MSQMVKIDLNPDERTLRQFGWIAFFGFSLLALVAHREWLVFSMGLGAAKPYVSGAFAVLAGLSALFSLVWPRANRPIYVGLALVSYPIGFVLSWVILGLLFYGMITPVGLLFRLIGRDPMNRRLDRSAKTYWQDARPPRPAESYFHQY
jgi:hypothetical protein